MKKINRIPLKDIGKKLPIEQLKSIIGGRNNNETSTSTGNGKTPSKP